jgi:hypothetical protein
MRRSFGPNANGFDGDGSLRVPDHGSPPASRPKIGPTRAPAPQLIAVMDGVGDERIRIAVDFVAGAHVIDIRVMTLLTKSSGVWCPTNKGCRIEPGSIRALISALEEVEAKASELFA